MTAVWTAPRTWANNELVDPAKVYPAEEAIELAKKTANTKFVGSVEVHIRTLIDAKKTEAHPFTSAARVIDGKLDYSGKQPELSI